MMPSPDNRWVLPDRESALKWCRERKSHKIRCIFDYLAGHARTESDASITTGVYLACAEAIADESMDASISVKPTTMGALFDRDISRENAIAIARKSAGLNVGFEIDIEGSGLVDHAIETAVAISEKGYPVTLALQAYLDRTSTDIGRILDSGIRVRLVKGAYLGDTGDFTEIQRRFRSLSCSMLNRGSTFIVGTHDPDIVEWLMGLLNGNRSRVEFSFLKGLADEIKVELAGQVWQVSEYVPFGPEKAAYEARRLRYLDGLEKIGRSPLT